MAKAAPEDHSKILKLQASLRQALVSWDDVGKPTSFDQVAPAANALVAAQREQLSKRAADQTAGRQRIGGWGLLAVAAVALVLLVLSAWNLWWLAVLVPALALGVYLLVLAGNRG